ncbi:MAG: hypothetical protein M0Z55_02180 [Peptococcaceae bacterium]|nr:hypothetical protein [Peptococcaceae bacterium]
MAKPSRNIAKHLTLVFLGTFVLAGIIDFGSELFVRQVSSLVLALLFLLFIILIHISFDIIAVAAMTASEVPFHSKAANRIHGSTHAVKLIRNADLVANLCADVIGDVTGTISGALTAGIALDILKTAPGWSSYEVLIGTVFLALVASLTVAGKAVGKMFAVKRAHEVIFVVGKIVAWVEGTTGLTIINTGKNRKRGKKT